MDMKGQSTASSGHVVKSGQGGSVELESSKWPFCFDADPKSAGSNRSILPFTSFNQDLNRLTLQVKNLGSAKAKVTWGRRARNSAASSSKRASISPPSSRRRRLMPRSPV
jgi:hypothetical protein